MRLTSPSLALLVVAFSACSDDPELIQEQVTRPNLTQDASPMGDGDSSADVTQPDTDVTQPDVDTHSPADTDVPDSGPVDTSDVTHPDSDATSDTDSSPDTDDGPVSDTLLSHPRIIAFPWAATGAAPFTHEIILKNLSSHAVSLRFTLDQGGAISLANTPSELAPQEQASLALRFAPPSTRSSHETFLRIEAQSLSDSDESSHYTIPVYAYAGSAALPSASFSAHSANGLTYGQQATVRLPSAPFPSGSSSWSDDSVHLFIPEGFFDRGPVPFVVHFHGHRTTLASTLPAHYYREQHWLSGINAVLVTPQGPVDAASGDFGKLMDSGGLKRLLDDVIDVLYRAGHILTPKSGDLILTEHSGGYQAVALNLDAQSDEGQVLAAHLFDGLYGYSDRFRTFAQAGGLLRSNHTSGGGTRSNNQNLLNALGSLAVPSPTFAALRDTRAVIWPTDAGHNQSTWHQLPFAETLRWSTRNAKRGPRVEVRFAYLLEGELHLNLLSPEDDFTSALRVERSPDCQTWTLVERLAPHLRGARLPWSGEGCLRVLPELEDRPLSESQASDRFWLSPDNELLVVNGFDRRLGGSWFDATHGHAARVGKAAKASAYASNEAIADGDLELSNFPVVLWLAGDQSTTDAVLPATERQVLTSALSQGTKLIVSGSEVAYALRSSAGSFLTSLGVSYVADDANRNTAYGVGPFAHLSEFSFGTTAAPYLEDYPDVLNAASNATALLRYSSSQIAAAGRAGQSAFIGFPLETLVSEEHLEALIAALLDFVSP